MMVLLVVLAIAPAANASSVQAYRWQLIFAINKSRHVHGLAPVRHAPGLDKTAQSHSADMVARHYFAHTSPTGSTLFDRISPLRVHPLRRLVGRRDAGLGIRVVCAAAQHVIGMWLASPTHRAVLLSSRFTLGRRRPGRRVVRGQARRPSGRPTGATASAPSAVRSPAWRPTKVLLASPRGYCAGVDRAVDTVERALDHFGAPVYVRKEIVHNWHVVQRAVRPRRRVRRLASWMCPRARVVVLSAHGVAPDVYRNSSAPRPADDRRHLPAGDEGARRRPSGSPPTATRSC